MITEDDYRVYLIDLPPGVNGVTMLGEDGFPSIYLNASLSPEGLERTFRHELWHIQNDDFYSDRPIREVEELATRKETSSEAS